MYTCIVIICILWFISVLVLQTATSAPQEVKEKGEFYKYNSVIFKFYILRFFCFSSTRFWCRKWWRTRRRTVLPQTPTRQMCPGWFTICIIHYYLLWLCWQFIIIIFVRFWPIKECFLECKLGIIGRSPIGA